MGIEGSGRESAVANRYAEVTYKVIGAAMNVHNRLGPGLKEVTYHDALSVAMREKGLSFEDEYPLEVTLSDERVGLLYIDHLVENAVVVEEKAFDHLLTNDDLAQILTYLAVSEAPLGLLLNFGRRGLEYQRVLPPRKFSDWRERAGRLAWQPRSATKPDLPADIHPLIRSTSAGNASLADAPEVDV